MATQIYSGYIGVYKQPYANTLTYGDTAYGVFDALHQELNILVLTPGAYREIYNFASAPSAQYINFFVPSMDVLWISDIFRLVTDLTKIKKSVNLYYPDPINPGLTNALFNIACKRYNSFISKRIDSFRIEYHLSDGSRADHKFYDIHLFDGEKYHIFTLFVDKDNIDNVLKYSAVDRIHMPYNTVFYGGLTAIECAKLRPELVKKVIVNNFNCREEYVAAADYRVFIMPQRFRL